MVGIALSLLRCVPVAVAAANPDKMREMTDLVSLALAAIAESPNRFLRKDLSGVAFRAAF
jgi:hypothetical protein